MARHLTPHQHALVLLRIYEYTDSEIAAVFDCHVQTVRNAFQGIYKKLAVRAGSRPRSEAELRVAYGTYVLKYNINVENFKNSLGLLIED